MKGVGSRRSFEMCDKSCVGVGGNLIHYAVVYLIIHPPVVSVFF